MKNVIFILIDAWGDYFLSSNNCRNSPTPFVDSIRENSLSVENMYSMAPFTEAAIIATLGGEKTFDNGFAMKSLGQCDELITELFKKKGYRTFMTRMPYIFPSAYYRGADQGIYNYFCQLSSTFDYRLNDFYEKYTNNTITDEDYKICYELLLDCMKEILVLYKKMYDDDEESSEIKEFLDWEFVEGFYPIIKRDYEKLVEIGEKYIEDLFSNWEKAEIRNYSKFSTHVKINSDMIEFLNKEYGELLKSIDAKTNELNNNNNILSIRYLLSEVSLGEDIFDKLRYFKRIVMGYSSMKKNNSVLHRAISPDRFAYGKGTISLNTQLAYFEDKILECDKNNENYFAYIHADDFHYPSVFFTYDTFDKDLLREEFKRVKAYVDNLPANYRGNIITDLSSVYIDFHIERFIKTIKEKLNNDVSIIITADHGYSYYNYPIRENVVNNFHLENFKIPFLIYDDNNHSSYKGLYSSADIKSIISKSILDMDVDIEDREYVTMEWIPGCPDYSRKKCFYGIFDGKYMIAAKVMYNEKIDISKVISVYDIENDPLETNNIKKKSIRNDRVIYLVNELSKRHEQVIKGVREVESR